MLSIRKRFWMRKQKIVMSTSPHASIERVPVDAIGDRHHLRINIQ
jgi:hypothetical protein